MDDIFAKWDGFKTPAYRDMYDEAHRRSPTPLRVPFISAHFGIRHPEHFAGTFKPYMRAMLLCLMHKQDEVSASDNDKVEAWVEQISLYYNDNKDTNVVEKLVFNFLEATNDSTDESSAIWRLEVHREYCTVTIFSSISEADIAHIKTEMPQAANDEMTTSPLLQARLRHLTQCKAALIEEVCNGFPDSLHFYAKRPPYSKPKKTSLKISLDVFVDYFGMVLPVSTLGSEDIASLTFPSTESNGFSDPSENKSEKLKAANAFLNDVITAPEGRTRLVRHIQPVNAVACFLFQGHFLFLSSMAARNDAAGAMELGDRSPSVYWLFYRDFPRTPAADHTYPDSGPDRRGSRLIYMLNTIGTARIAALFNMKKMKDFSQRLRRLEQEVLKLRRDDGVSAVKKSRKFRAELTEAESQVGESILYRASRTAYYRAIMNTLINDLAIESIPSWQGLDKFIRRRLDPAIAYLGNLGERYESLNTLIANEWAINMGDQLLSIQTLSESILTFLILYYVPHAFENTGELIDSILRSSHGASGFQHGAFVPVEGFHYYKELAFCAGMAFAWLSVGWIWGKRFYKWLRRLGRAKS